MLLGQISHSQVGIRGREMPTRSILVHDSCGFDWSRLRYHYHEFRSCQTFSTRKHTAHGEELGSLMHCADNGE
jgi:hypothetical protein